MFRLKPEIFPWQKHHVGLAAFVVALIYSLQKVFFAHDSSASPWDYFCVILIQAAAFVLPALFVLFFCYRRSRSSAPDPVLIYNPVKLWFGPRTLPKDLIVGLVLGLILALLNGSSIKQFTPEGLWNIKAPLSRMVVRSHTLKDVGILLLGVGVIAPLAEEIFFRGVIYTALRKQLHFIPSMFVSAFLFSMAHMGSMRTHAFLVGMIAAILLEYTGSIVPAIIMHMGVNIGFVIFLANSGTLAALLPSWGIWGALFLLNILLFALGYPLFAPNNELKPELPSDDDDTETNIPQD